MKTVAILFTGGKDSSLVACLEASKGNEIHLLTCNSGIGIKSELSQLRVNELIEPFPEVDMIRTILSTSGCYVKLGLKTLKQI